MALIFLTDADIRTAIRTEFFNYLKDNNPLNDQEILDLSELSAIQKMKSKLRGRYNVEEIFTATGTDRNALVVEYCTDIFLHRLHCRINPRKVSESVKEKYAEALDWLDGVMDGKENPDLPPIAAPEQSTNKVLYGGSQKPTEHYY